MPTDNTAIQQDLAILAQQEALLRFTTFDPGTAWQLGSLLRANLLTLTAGCTVEIERDRQLLFACTTSGAKPDQADWIRRKRNTVHRFHRSSYATGRELALNNATLESAHDLSETDFAAHGGGFPLWLTGDATATFAGTIILSGLPQRDDHNLVVTAIAQHLNLTIPHLP
jgi:uncharacterized protein (UPF0303 family)